MSQSPYKGFNRVAVIVRHEGRIACLNPPIRGSIDEMEEMERELEFATSQSPYKGFNRELMLKTKGVVNDIGLNPPIRGSIGKNFYPGLPS